MWQRVKSTWPALLREQSRKRTRSFEHCFTLRPEFSPLRRQFASQPESKRAKRQRTSPTDRGALEAKEGVEYRLNPDLSLPTGRGPDGVGGATKRPWAKIIHPITRAKFYILPLDIGSSEVAKRALVKCKPTVIVYNITEETFKAVQGQVIRPQKLGFVGLLNPIEYFKSFRYSHYVLAEPWEDFKTIMSYAHKVGIPVIATEKDMEQSLSRNLVDTFFGSNNAKIGANQWDVIKYRWHNMKTSWQALVASGVEIPKEDAKNLRLLMGKINQFMEGDSGKKKWEKVGEKVYNLQLETIEMVCSAIDSIHHGNNAIGAAQRMTTRLNKIVNGQTPLNEVTEKSVAELRTLLRESHSTTDAQYKTNKFMNLPRQRQMHEEEATQIAYQIRILGDDPELHGKDTRVLAIVSPILLQAICEKLATVTRDDYDWAIGASTATQDTYWMMLKYWTGIMALPCAAMYWWKSLVAAEMLFGLPPIFILAWGMHKNFRNRRNLINFYDHIEKVSSSKIWAPEEFEKNLDAATTEAREEDEGSEPAVSHAEEEELTSDETLVSQAPTKKKRRKFRKSETDTETTNAHEGPKPALEKLDAL